MKDNKTNKQESDNVCNSKTKIKFFNKYIVWNLAFSIFSFVFIIFLIFFGIFYDKNIPSGHQLSGSWFYIFIGVTCIWTIFCFVPNAVYTTQMLIYYVKNKQTKMIVLFAFGYIVPFVTCYPYYLKRKQMVDKYNQELGNK